MASDWTMFILSDLSWGLWFKSEHHPPRTSPDIVVRTEMAASILCGVLNRAHAEKGTDETCLRG